MNFSVHIDAATADALERLVRETGKSRNALIVEAVRGLLAGRGRGWPASVRSWLDDGGDRPDIPPFEASRDGLVEPAEPTL